MKFNIITFFSYLSFLLFIKEYVSLISLINLLTLILYFIMCFKSKKTEENNNIFMLSFFGYLYLFFCLSETYYSIPNLAILCILFVLYFIKEMRVFFTNKLFVMGFYLFFFIYCFL